MRKIATAGLLLMALLALFPPVRPLEPHRSLRSLGDHFWSVRTCLIKADPYRRERTSGDGYLDSVDTAIDLPRLTCELLFVASVTGILALRRTREPIFGSEAKIPQRV